METRWFVLVAVALVLVGFFGLAGLAILGVGMLLSAAWKAAGPSVGSTWIPTGEGLILIALTIVGFFLFAHYKAHGTLF